MTLTATRDQEMTSGVFVYGIVRADRRLPDGLVGLGGAGLRVVTSGQGLGAVVSEIALDDDARRRAADLVAYGRVVDELAQGGPVAPVRFGSVLPDDAAVLDDLLQDDGQYFAELLDSLSGRVQFTLRATYDEQAVLTEVVHGDPEIAALREVTRNLPAGAPHGAQVQLGELVARALEQKREADADMIMDVVKDHVVDAHVRLGSGMEQLLTASLLVEQSHAAVLEEKLDELAEVVHERIRLGLVGPLAPYDFVGGA